MILLGYIMSAICLRVMPPPPLFRRVILPLVQWDVRAQCKLSCDLLLKGRKACLTKLPELIQQLFNLLKCIQICWELTVQSHQAQPLQRDSASFLNREAKSEENLGPDDTATEHHLKQL